MNSLEFIKKEIEFLKDMIDMDLALVEDEFDLQEIANKQKCLDMYCQIKDILEAWEAMKEEITFDTNSYDCDDRSYTFEYAQFYIDNEEKLDKLHKALEIKNE